MGRFANMANSRLANPDRKARLCDISWMDRNKFWLAVAPKTYATAQNFNDQKGVFRSRYASAIWRETTPRTTYLVKGSGPQSLVTCEKRSVSQMGLCRQHLERVRTSGCALMIASRLVRCGSSVYVQKKSRYLVSMASCSAGDMSFALPLALGSFLCDVELVIVVVEGAITTV
jgi:hypothetical protein